ncbi:winged helix-turn-helix transcriptional regulator [Desertimonas flava]|uniref:winged helix-turn-helix transcriptional regulator n=1 Tax=Desertimonas flava TaxID=2064846 RepID=UPI000E349A27|nr:helix-turn-helix domain-containing protein [Desertimonas flava]
MSVRRYGQFCAIAKSLDVVGDRWALLVVRDLLLGPRRYNELLEQLDGISTDMLALRLRELEAAGVVERLPVTGKARTYQLTPRGRELEPVIDALARWGRPLLAERADGDVVAPAWFARSMASAMRKDRPGTDLLVRLDTDALTVDLHITEDAVTVSDADAPPHVTLTGSLEAIAAALDPQAAAELVASGQLTVEGAPRRVRQLSRLFASDTGSRSAAR